MKTKGRSTVLFILSFIVIAFLAFTGFKGFEIGGWEFKNFEKTITKGLDLQGGVSVLMEIKDADVSVEDLEKTRELIDLRVNKLGVAETAVTTEGNNRIRVEIPGQYDSKELVDSLSATGELTFKDSEGNVVISGSDIESASVVMDNQTNKPVVSLKLNAEGKNKFAQATAANIKGIENNLIEIYMDDELISKPKVQSAITDGEAIISGSADVEEAKTLASLINAGALPVSIEVASISNVGAQLGEEALPNAIKAGAIGIGAIFIFMIAYYRIPGIIASMALTLYTTLVLFIFSENGVALTLPGIKERLISKNSS